MSTKVKTSILVASAAVLLFTFAGGINGVHASNDGAYRQMTVYSEVLSRVRSEYVEEPDLPQVTDGALHGLLESLDSNSSYLSPEQYKDFKSRQTNAKVLILPPSVGGIRGVTDYVQLMKYDMDQLASTLRSAGE